MFVYYDELEAIKEFFKLKRTLYSVSAACLKGKSVFMVALLHHIDEIRKLCVHYSVKSLYAFGSITTNKFRSDSDIDLIIDINETDPISYSDCYFNFKFHVEELLQRPIDLLEQKAIKNPYLKQRIEETKVLIYESRN